MMKFHVILPSGDTEDYIKTFDEFIDVLSRSGYFVKHGHYANSRYASTYAVEVADEKAANFLSNISLYDWVTVYSFGDKASLDECIHDLELETIE